MERQRKKIVIVGGGISGLSAAFYTKKLFEEQRIPIDLTLVEQTDRFGGKIRTLHRDGFVIERGPDSFLARKPAILGLTKELGLEDELTAMNPHAKTNYILHKGNLHSMPLGLVLGIPTEAAPFIKTGLISPAGKLRAAMDLFLPRKRGASDESLGSFIQRRLGREVLENITEPLLAGIYAGDTRSLSVTATFPRFKELEQKQRSIILGMLAGKQKTPAANGLPDIAKSSMFLTYRGGLVTLVNRLVEALRPISMITGQGVSQLIRDGGRYRLILDHAAELQADGVIVALPAFEAARLLPDIPHSKWLKQMPHVSVANLALAYRQQDIRFPLDGSGFVVPRKEGRAITACTWSSSKWLHAAPSGSILLRCYVGRSSSQEWMRLSDRELLDCVTGDLQSMMGISAEPVFCEITRCFRSMPQYQVGHVEQLGKLREQLEAQKPGIFLCGASYQGVGIPDCIEQGKKAAEQMMNHFSSISSGE